VYNKVEIWLNTHDAGDIVTDKDKQLAKAIDVIFKNKK
jgi:4a-hydroxytetrahydrobiopterin dehydratase